MKSFLSGVAALVMLILACALIIYLTVLVAIWSETETNIYPDIPGMIPNEAEITRIKSFFPLRTIKYYKNFDTGEEKVETIKYSGSIECSAEYHPRIGIILIETKKYSLSFSNDSKTWSVKNKKNDLSDYKSEVSPDNAFLKQKIAEANDLFSYARKRFRNILIKAGAMGAEDDDLKTR